MDPRSTRARYLGPRRIGLLAVAGGLLLGLMSVAPVSATMFFSEHYTDDYEFTFDCNGTPIEVVGHAEGVFHVRTGKGKLESAFFAHDNYEFTETGTDPDGNVVVLKANGLFQETRATHVEGTIFMFSSVNAGQPFTVYDGDGNLLIRDRGVIRETILFDTLGDGMPGGEFIESVSFEVAGPHPGLDFDICTAFD